MGSVNDRKYLLSDVDMGEEEAQAVAEVVRSKWLSVGPRTDEFEGTFASRFECEHAVALSSCTAALHLALLATDIGPGDEVLVPSYTFVASANCILYQGATPVFVDIEGPHDLNLSCDDMIAKITPRTKAIIVVHLAGFGADMQRIMEIAKRHNLAVIEDACHGVGATYHAPGSPLHGRKLGTIGDAGCFSFFANKNLVTGEGGMLVTNDAQIEKRVRLARSHGMTKSSWDKAEGRAYDYDVVQLGFNYRCTELTAAMGMIQLEKLAAGNERRKQLVTRYRKRLSNAAHLSIPFADRIDDSAHHIFPVLLDHGISRDAFREELNQQGIQTSVHYPPVHLFSQYQQRCPDQADLSRTVDAAAREVTLPLHPLLEVDDVDAICDAVMQWPRASV